MSILPPWKDLVAEPLSKDHVVQLYRDDRFLVETVALFAGVGIGKGESVVLVATPEHLEAIEQRLKALGFDIHGIKLWGQLLTMDAAKLLSSFMVNGSPDAALFKTMIGEVLNQARAGGRYRKVRVYGEMVELLWRDNRTATRRLEGLWNEVVSDQSISLLCGYSLAGDTGSHGQFPKELGDLHTHLIPIEACGGPPAATAGPDGSEAS